MRKPNIPCFILLKSSYVLLLHQKYKDPCCFEVRKLFQESFTFLPFNARIIEMSIVTR